MIDVQTKQSYYNFLTRETCFDTCTNVDISHIMDRIFIMCLVYITVWK